MKTLVCFVLVLCSVAIVAAQEKAIDQTEYDSAVAEGHKHHVRWKDEKYRMTVLTSAKVIGRPQNDWSSKIIAEYVPTGQNRSVSSSTFGGKANPVQESIIIGKWRYTRVGDNSWNRNEHEPNRAQAQGVAPENPFETVGTVTDYKYVGREFLGGRATNVYRKTERKTKVNKKNGETSESEAKATYWFGDDGIMLKHDYRSETRSANATSETLILMEWAIDPSIVITEPLLTSAN